MKRNKTFFYGSLIALAAGLLIFPNHTFAEEQASPLIATGTTVNCNGYYTGATGIFRLAKY